MRFLLLSPVSGLAPYQASGDLIAEGVTAGPWRASMERMPTIPRRVVTGHDARGLDVLGSDALGSLLHGPMNHGPMEAPGTSAGTTDA